MFRGLALCQTWKNYIRKRGTVVASQRDGGRWAFYGIVAKCHKSTATEKNTEMSISNFSSLNMIILHGAERANKHEAVLQEQDRHTVQTVPTFHDENNCMLIAKIIHEWFDFTSMKPRINFNRQLNVNEHITRCSGVQG